MYWSVNVLSCSPSLVIPKYKNNYSHLTSFSLIEGIILRAIGRIFLMKKMVYGQELKGNTDIFCSPLITSISNIEYEFT